MEEEKSNYRGENKDFQNISSIKSCLSCTVGIGS